MAQRERQKQQSHRRIVSTAAQMLRERGASDTNVADVMAAAGLTHGGFYAHFPNKQAMLQEALVQATEHRDRWLDAPANDAPANGDAPEEDTAAWLARIAKRYLNRGHRDHPATGCPYPAVLAELGREQTGVRTVLRRELDETIERLAAGLGGGAAARADARALLALFIGALQLSRVYDGRDSDQILAAARAFALAAAGPPTRSEAAEPQEGCQP